MYCLFKVHRGVKYYPGIARITIFYTFLLKTTTVVISSATTDMTSDSLKSS